MHAPSQQQQQPNQSTEKEDAETAVPQHSHQNTMAAAQANIKRMSVAQISQLNHQKYLVNLNNSLLFTSADRDSQDSPQLHSKDQVKANEDKYMRRLESHSKRQRVNDRKESDNQRMDLKLSLVEKNSNSKQVRKESIKDKGDVDQSLDDMMQRIETLQSNINERRFSLEPVNIFNSRNFSTLQSSSNQQARNNRMGQSKGIFQNLKHQFLTGKRNTLAKLLNDKKDINASFLEGKFSSLLPQGEGSVELYLGRNYGNKLTGVNKKSLDFSSLKPHEARYLKSKELQDHQKQMAQLNKSDLLQIEHGMMSYEQRKELLSQLGLKSATIPTAALQFDKQNSLLQELEFQESDQDEHREQQDNQNLLNNEASVERDHKLRVLIFSRNSQLNQFRTHNQRPVGLGQSKGENAPQEFDKRLDSETYLVQYPNFLGGIEDRENQRSKSFNGTKNMSTVLFNHEGKYSFVDSKQLISIFDNFKSNGNIKQRSTHRQEKYGELLPYEDLADQSLNMGFKTLSETQKQKREELKLKNKIESNQGYQLDKIEKSYKNVQKLTRKAYESQINRMKQLDKSSLSIRVIDKIKDQQSQRRLNYVSPGKKDKKLSDILYEQYLKNQADVGGSISQRLSSSSSQKFLLNDPIRKVSQNATAFIKSERDLQNKDSDKTPKVISTDLHSRNVQSIFNKQRKTIEVQINPSLLHPNYLKKPQTGNKSQRTIEKLKVRKTQAGEIQLFNNEEQEDSRDVLPVGEIQDQRLKKFYQHLDDVNQKQVNAFQYFNRYRKSQQQSQQPQSQQTNWNQELNKSDIVNSMSYKLKNNVHSNYQTTDYFPQWIVDEMQKIDQNTSFSNQNIFKLCQKLHKDRGINERRAICDYLKKKIKFFKDIEKEKLETLTQKIATLEYDPKQVLIKQGDEGGFLLIIYEGKVEILVDDKKIAEAGPHTLIGESALEYKSKRKASVIALSKCKCLALYKADYDSAVALFKSQQKHLNYNILRQLHVIGDWNIIKIRGFARLLNEVQFPKGKIIYDIADSPESLYIVKRGRVSLEVLYEIERTNSIPVGQKQWEIQRTFQVIRRNILTINHTHIFGMEEIILENPKRIIRARALEDTECLYANRNVFMEYFNTEDKEKFRRMISEYTDFEKEAKLLLFEIQNKKNVSNQFLNAVNLNVGSITQESRSTSQNGYLTSHHFNPKKNKMVKQFLQRIVQNNTESPLDHLRNKNTKRQQYIEDYYKQFCPTPKKGAADSHQQSFLTLQDSHINLDSNPGAYGGDTSTMQKTFLNMSPEQKMKIFKTEMIETQKRKKETKTLQVKKHSILVNSNNVLENIKGGNQSPTRSKSLKPGAQQQSTQNMQLQENGVKIRLITDKVF